MHVARTGRPLPSELVRQHHIIALARQPWTFRIGHEHVFVGVDFGGFLEAISGRIPLGDVEVAVGAEGNDGFARGVHGHAYGLVPVGVGGDFDGFSGGEKNEPWAWMAVNAMQAKHNPMKTLFGFILNTVFEDAYERYEEVHLLS